MMPPPGMAVARRGWIQMCDFMHVGDYLRYHFDCVNFYEALQFYVFNPSELVGHVGLRYVTFIIIFILEKNI